MKNNTCAKFKKINIKRILASMGIAAIMTGFIFSTPLPNLSPANSSIAYAKDGCTLPNSIDPDGNCGLGGCTNGNATNYNSSATFDDNSCQFSYCTDKTALNYGQSGGCTYKTEIPGCTNSSYTNYNKAATKDDGSCANPVYGCMDSTDKNFNPLATINDPAQCEGKPANTYCCDGNFSNYVAPSSRQSPYDCEYMEPTCACNDSQTGSQCGNGDTSCKIDAKFSVTKSGINIAGNASMIKASGCSDSDYAYLVGAAAGSASPATPLDVPQEIDSFTTFTVTSLDYCLNVEGIQSSTSGYNRNDSGFCCDIPNVVNTTGDGCESGVNIPQCGDATLNPTESAPTTKLCNNGNPSSITTATDSFSWSCSLPDDTSTSCSVTKTCNGGSCSQCTANDCGPDDVCKNISGSQTQSQLSDLNLTAYGNSGGKSCYNSSSGVCGSLTSLSFVTASLTSASLNLCDESNHGMLTDLSDMPSYTFYPNVGTQGEGIWTWSCSVAGVKIDPICTVPMCQGDQCYQQQSTSGHIRSLKIQPAIVAAPTDTCNITWTTDIDSSTVNPVQGCKLQDAKHNVLSTDDDNTTGTSVSPGQYTLMCSIGGDTPSSETKNVKCSVKPSYKEI